MGVHHSLNPESAGSALELFSPIAYCFPIFCSICQLGYQLIVKNATCFCSINFQGQQLFAKFNPEFKCDCLARLHPLRRRI